ncbi:MAG: hypothetical protein ACRDZ4_23015, partial [Egibacteraceae bacterium]
MDPGLRFWLRYAEHSGGLCEAGDDVALAVLPAGLQAALDLPEEVAVTADPDVAREDGALLLVPGHPALDRAAADTLDGGDAGHAFLPWPAPTRPATEVLLTRARERFRVAHGRVDPDGDPDCVYAPLLRVGMLVTYALSLDHRFQEREEVWVDARTGLPLDDAARRALESWALLATPDADHPPLDVDLSQAIPRAHACLTDRAVSRQRALAAQVDQARREELARAEAYYDAALASIARRRGSASPERQALLDAQAEATRTERGRRLHEIDEQFRPSHELRPFRLHLVWAPALRLAVRIRRGAQAYPCDLTWLLGGAATFTDLRCPNCGAAEPLVAGRERL